MRDASLERWEKVTHISVGFAWGIAALFGISGYATFRALSQGNQIIIIHLNKFLNYRSLIKFYR
jgi:hypothetical protein